MVDWFGEVSEMLVGNLYLYYVVLFEGSNLWFDNLVIFKMVKYFKVIYVFLNFMSEFKNVV